MSVDTDATTDLLLLIQLVAHRAVPIR